MTGAGPVADTVVPETSRNVRKRRICQIKLGFKFNAQFF